MTGAVRGMKNDEGLQNKTIGKIDGTPTSQHSPPFQKASSSPPDTYHYPHVSALYPPISYGLDFVKLRTLYSICVAW